MTPPFFDNWRPKTRSQDYYDLSCHRTEVECAIRDGDLDPTEGRELIRRIDRALKRSQRTRTSSRLTARVTRPSNAPSPLPGWRGVSSL